MMNSSPKEEPFQTLYNALWERPLDPILQNAPARAGAPVLKHIPLTMLKELGLIPFMNFPEQVLLIREEYDTALDTLQDWSRNEGGGVVVTGQPGIGACYLDAS